MEKVEFLKANGLCFGCLEKGHISKVCKKHMSCHICQNMHPTILHVNKKEKDCSDSTLTSPSTSSALVSLNANKVIGAGMKRCALAVVPVKVKRGTKVVKTYAFLDGGSSTTFCTESLMHQLNIVGRKQIILLKTMGQTKTVPSHKINGLEVAALESDMFIKLPDVYTHKSIPFAKENIPKMEDIKRWSYLEEVDLNPINANIGLLIGVNAPRAMEPWKVINSQGSGPYAVKTLLGWVISGPLSDEGNEGSLQCNRISIEELLVQQYNQDFTEQHYKDKDEMSVEDLEFMKNSFKLCCTGEWTLQLAAALSKD